MDFKDKLTIIRMRTELDIVKEQYLKFLSDKLLKHNYIDFRNNVYAIADLLNFNKEIMFNYLVNHRINDIKHFINTKENFDMCISELEMNFQK
jgi:hypothetical protein